MTTTAPIARPLTPATPDPDQSIAIVRLIDDLAARLDAAGGLSRADLVRMANVVHPLLRRLPVWARREALGG
jgi:hypothetical protein